MKHNLVIRTARENDIDEITAMIDDFSIGHPSENHPRQKFSLKKAFFSGNPIAHLCIAERQNTVLGMGQWMPYYDMFWGQFGGILEWLYVKPKYRGSGVSASIVAELCAQVRKNGGEFVYGEGLNQNVSKLYEQVAIGWEARKCAISGEAFQAFADLAGLPPRQIVKELPKPELNKVAAKKRG
jgi:N-acetylglutamate synthase-like GNAT family acetyltransferase